MAVTRKRRRKEPRRNGEICLKKRFTYFLQPSKKLNQQSNIISRNKIHLPATTVGKFINTISSIVNDLMPIANPCLYCKQWFSLDLKRQQKAHNKLRRAWQSGCAIRGRDHPFTISQFTAMQKSKREWTRAIEKAKSSHWGDFLDGARSGNLLWKAARYTKPLDSNSNIPPLKIGEAEISEDKEKAALFLNTFFPQPAPYKNPDEDHPQLQIP